MDSEIVTASYDTATGAPEGISRFRPGPGLLQAAVGRGVAVDPQSRRLFVTGYVSQNELGTSPAAVGVVTHNDLVTAAYDLSAP